jgi:hypothetical protein
VLFPPPIESANICFFHFVNHFLEDCQVGFHCEEAALDCIFATIFTYLTLLNDAPSNVGLHRVPLALSASSAAIVIVVSTFSLELRRRGY